jgi:hypothetical protein
MGFLQLSALSVSVSSISSSFAVIPMSSFALGAAFAHLESATKDVSHFTMVTVITTFF